MSQTTPSLDGQSLVTVATRPDEPSAQKCDQAPLWLTAAPLTVSPRGGEDLKTLPLGGRRSKRSFDQRGAGAFELGHSQADSYAATQHPESRWPIALRSTGKGSFDKTLQQCPLLCSLDDALHPHVMRRVGRVKSTIPTTHLGIAMSVQWRVIGCGLRYG